MKWSKAALGAHKWCSVEVTDHFRWPPPVHTCVSWLVRGAGMHVTLWLQNFPSLWSIWALVSSTHVFLFWSLSFFELSSSCFMFIFMFIFGIVCLLAGQNWTEKAFEAQSFLAVSFNGNAAGTLTVQPEGCLQQRRNLTPFFNLKLIWCVSQVCVYQLSRPIRLWTLCLALYSLYIWTDSFIWYESLIFCPSSQLRLKKEEENNQMRWLFFFLFSFYSLNYQKLDLAQLI